MRKTVRLFSAVGPTQRLGEAIAALPQPVQRALVQVAERADLALVAGSWQDDAGGCLVANAVACVSGHDADHGAAERTLDLRMLDAFPQMSSRDLNLLIVAWDEAAAQSAATTDAELRDLLRGGLARAGLTVQAAPPSGGVGDAAWLQPAVVGGPS